MSHLYRAAIFDLDGVIIDSTQYHYQAWKQIARELGFEFTIADNERLKGVSRVRSLEILLEIGQITLSNSEKAILLERKSHEYLKFICQMDENSILPGALNCLQTLKKKNIKIGLGSASKKSRHILSQLNIISYFDAIVDGNQVQRTKPAPDIFLQASGDLGVSPQECVVFEDSIPGIQAAKAAGMVAVGIGDPAILWQADHILSGLQVFQIEQFFP